MPPIRAVYENGVFRPLEPVAPPEGARVAVVTLGSLAPAEAAAPLVGAELTALLEEIDSLPLEGPSDPTLAKTYRQTLYPKQGEIPGSASTPRPESRGSIRRINITRPPGRCASGALRLPSQGDGGAALCAHSPLGTMPNRKARRYQPRPPSS
jgi:predicted DNA-binding antitoxin AbrB/MazE fold protein